MKKAIPLLIGCLLLVGLNWTIWGHEQTLKTGETLFLKLAPADPRSLMQGDYMRLAFSIERTIDKKTSLSQPKTGRLIITTDENNIGKFVDFYRDQPLTENQKTIRYSKSRWRGTSINIEPRSFFFQEGHAKHYEQAKYGVFKYKDGHTYLLEALADENQTIITPR